MMKKPTKKEYEKFINAIGTPDDDKKSKGGRVPDNCKYGSWLRKNDPVRFEIGYQVFLQWKKNM